jgi:protein-S-isoprenylcysteine O-methyltransferase Ste14
MKATPFEFRFRFLIHAVLYVVSFVMPWNKWLHLDTVRTWQWLASLLSRAGVLGFSQATLLVLVLGICFALAAALLRTWGAAYLGRGVVQDSAMRGDQVVAAGPYRYVRNPLYLGTFLHSFALALLTMPSGAAFMLVTIGLFELRLIGAEERFLSERLGEAYNEYRLRVPRLLPSLRPQIESSGARPAWGGAVLSEVYMWGVAISFAALGWMYNAVLILQGVLVSLGVSLVMRALLPKPQSTL